MGVATFVFILCALAYVALKAFHPVEYESKVIYERKPIEYIDGIQTYYYIPYDTILIKKQSK